MPLHDAVILMLYFVALLAMSPPLGAALARALNGERFWLTRSLGWLERGLLALGGASAGRQMTAREYINATLIFTGVNVVWLLILQLLQAYLPLNPRGYAAPGFWLALNTAISFASNTNWQAYSGEAQFGYLVQMLGFGVQNFISAAAGLAALLAMARGLGKDATGPGNFWVDLVRSVVYVLLPLSLILALFLLSQGVVMTFSDYVTATTLEGETQIIPLGPAAAQIAIKQLGTNGGGFFGVNSAHPFENPTVFSNFAQCLAILLIPSALIFSYGRIVGAMRHAWRLYSAVLMLFGAALAIALYAELQGLPNPGIVENLEGKELRVGVSQSALWATATTAASNGSVNSMISSLSPIASGVALFLMLLGEVVYGGVGVGLTGLLMFVILAVFLAGLMVGRTPEYLGKRIEKREVQLAMIAVLTPSALILIFTAIAVQVEAGLAARANAGPHGLSEILYAFASASANNGSAFAGLGAGADFYAITQSACMALGRLAALIPAIAIGASMAQKKSAPQGPGSFAVESFTFVILLIAVILIVGGLTFFPALLLGPGLEALLVHS